MRWVQRTLRPLHLPLVVQRVEDDALLGLFLVAFDRMVRHELALQRRYVWRERTWKKVPVPVRTGGYPGRLAASWQASWLAASGSLLADPGDSLNICFFGSLPL